MKKETISQKKTINKKMIILPIVIGILILIPIITFLMIRPKFKDVEIELGTTDINVETFLVSKMYKKYATLETDLEEADLKEVGEKEITLSYHGKKQTVRLNIVDTTPPKVEFQDIIKSYGYEATPEDFIKSNEDFSPTTVEILEQEATKEDTDYRLKIRVADAAGNETTGECNLKISWIIPEIELELGDDFSLQDIVLDVKKFGKYISSSELKKVDTSKAGVYTIKAEYDGEEFTSTITIKDTTAPKLTLKKVKIYDDEKEIDYKKFISKASDASGEVTTTLKTEIEYGKVGKQEITIEAKDASGNTTTKTTTLTIQKDTVGPVFSGLTEKTVKKNANVNYTSGVKATDAKDGNCEFTIDASNVKINTAGAYYVTYTAKDKSGNKTTKKRKITVLHDASDTDRKFNEFYDSYLAGKSVEGMAKEIWTRIKGTSDWGGDDPVWYGLTTGNGNCYVHAMIMQKALKKAGYQNYIIYRTDKGHYWNLVKVNGVWRHIDATPKYNTSLLTDEQKLAQPELKGGTWDTSKWPAAE